MKDRRRGASPPPPVFGRNGEARNDNSRQTREKQTFSPFCFTIWPPVVVKRQICHKSVSTKHLQYICSSTLKSWLVKAPTTAFTNQTQRSDRPSTANEPLFFCERGLTSPMPGTIRHA